jgi:hypothetical protein
VADPLPEQPSLPPNTTKQQDITFEGQRKVNLIWEYTQAIIAVFVVVSTLGTATWLVVSGRMDQIPTIFSFAFGTIVGFYFSRTNHAAIGGMGQKPNQPYEGR